MEIRSREALTLAMATTNGSFMKQSKRPILLEVSSVSNSTSLTFGVSSLYHLSRSLVSTSHSAALPAYTHLEPWPSRRLSRRAQTLLASGM